MADSADGTLDGAAARMAARAERLRDLTPAMKAYGAWLEKQVDDGFDQSREFGGAPFPELKQSTIDSRIRRAGGFKTNKRSGLLTAGAAKKQAKLIAPGGIKPLVDTARARNSQHFDARADGGTWSAVGYLGPHMTGGKAGLQRRNPTPFEYVAGKWSLKPEARRRFTETVTAYVLDAKVVA